MPRAIKLEDGRYGARAVLTAPWSDSLMLLLEQHGVVEIELNMAKGWMGNDLSFLKRLPHLKALEVLDLRPSLKSIEPIHALHALKSLGVTTYCPTKIDFAAFPLLEECSLEWGKRECQSLFACTSLKNLFVNRYPGDSITPFTRLSSLESLTILNSPINSLVGLGSLNGLRKLRLGMLRKLGSLAGIEGLSQLEELAIETCKQINSIDAVGALMRLKKLTLGNIGEIESLRVLRRLHALEWVCFPESTSVLDGDLSPLVQLKNLRRVSFQNRRHYSHRREDFGVR